jgi:hypothetical protein
MPYKPQWKGSKAEHKAYVAYLRKFPKAALSASQKSELQKADARKRRR